MTAAVPSNSAWHYVVGTISGTTGTIYKDGVSAASGTVTAFAGTGSYGDGGDGALAPAAELGYVLGVALHGGYLYWNQFDGARTREHGAKRVQIVKLPRAARPLVDARAAVFRHRPSRPIAGGRCP